MRGLSGSDTEPKQDALKHIQSQARNGVKVSARYLTERFGAKSYSWPTVATVCFTASLSGKGKCEARSDGTPREGAELVRAPNNSHMLGKGMSANRVGTKLPDPHGISA